MEDSSSEKYKEERALRAIQVATVSGFLKDNLRLKESCLIMCNSCRECVPLRFLRVDRDVPSTLLAMFWPDVICTTAEGDSRVLPPRRVLEVRWMFDDPVGRPFLVGEAFEEEEEKYDKEGEGEEEEGDKEKEEESMKEGKVQGDRLTSCSVDVSKVSWPEGLRKLFLVYFNRPVDGVIGPDCLQVLAFHIPSRVVGNVSYVDGTLGIFDSPLDGVTFPSGLRELFLGGDFNYSIAGVAWPGGLERLSMPGFNKPIHDVQWPPALKTLEFSMPGEFENRGLLNTPWGMQENGFDQPLGTFLPMSLETLLLSNLFGQPLRGVTWPSGLAALGLGLRITEHFMDGVEWPPSLRKLFFSESFPNVQMPPPGCEVVILKEFETDISNDEFDQHSWNDMHDYANYYYPEHDYDSGGSHFSL